MSLRLLLVCVAILWASEVQAAIVQGELYGIPDEGGVNIGSTVDHWNVHVNTAGVVTIDVLSWERDDADLFDGDGVTDEYFDVNGDGEIAFFDSYIYLFHDDGSLDPVDAFAENDDDSGFGFGDGSISLLDSYMSIDLAGGDYILAIGAFDLSINDAIDQINNSSFNYPWTTNEQSNGHGDYQITFSGDVTVEAAAAVPEPSTLTMFGLGGLGLVLGARRRRFRKVV